MLQFQRSPGPADQILRTSSGCVQGERQDARVEYKFRMERIGNHRVVRKVTGANM